MVSTSRPKKDKALVYPLSPSRRAVEVSGRADDSLLTAYLKQAMQVPLLTVEEEVALARAWEEGQKVREELHAETARERHDELLAIAEAGVAAYRRLVEANLRLVVKLARQRHPGDFPGLGLLDLVQEGNLGLMHAVTKYDWRLGYRFSTYAVWWVRRAIERAIAEHARSIRIPPHLREAIGKLAQAEAQLIAETARQPTKAEMAKAAGMTEEQAAKLQRYLQPVISLDRPVGEEGSTHLGDTIVDGKTTATMEDVPQRTLGDELDALLDALPPREQQLIRLRFGLDGEGQRTLEEVGQALGITRERARQIEARTLSKLRNCQAAAGLRDYFSR